MSDAPQQPDHGEAVKALEAQLRAAGVTEFAIEAPDAVSAVVKIGPHQNLRPDAMRAMMRAWPFQNHVVFIAEKGDVAPAPELPASKGEAAANDADHTALTPP